MKVEKTERGFHVIYAEVTPERKRLIGESSIIGPYEDSFENPGSSYLVVDDILINREEVAELIQHLQYWLEYKSLAPNEKKGEENENKK